MVSIFTVFDRSVKANRYVVANDEGFNWQTIDNIGHEPPADLTDDDIYLDYFNWDRLTTEPSPTQVIQRDLTDDEFELFKYCQFEFYKKFCADFKIKVKLPADQLPMELFNTLSQEELDWHKEHECDFATDGYKVYTDELYVSKADREYDSLLQEIKDFSQWFKELPADNDFVMGNKGPAYSYATLTLGNRAIQLPMHADTYQLIEELLEDVIDQW